MSGRVDLHWPELRVAIELDGWGAHRTRARWEADHDRDLGLARYGYRTDRISWRQYRHDRAGVVAALRAILTEPGGPRTPARA